MYFSFEKSFTGAQVTRPWDNKRITGTAQKEEVCVSLFLLAGIPVSFPE